MKQLVILMIFMVAAAFSINANTQKATTKTVCFKSNMNCAECQKTLTEHLKFEKGVKDLSLDFVSNTIKVVYKDGKNTDEGFAKSIEKKGYVAEKITVEEYTTLLEKKKQK